MSSVKMWLSAFTLAVASCQAQTPPPQAAAQPAAHPDPAITQIRKSVTFIKLRCDNSPKKGKNPARQEFDVRGTGFFVSYPDPRLAAGRSFVYLVTNRHVAMCWNDSGHPMLVENIAITLNRKQGDGDAAMADLSLNDHGNAPWVLPQDDSVDLAAIPLGPNPARFDYITLALDMFASDDLLRQQRIAEGEPVFFAGFFYQFPGTSRMEPIVRQGIIAMMPSDKIPFVNIAEKLYLADLHAFGGNSGSPAFINLAGYHNGSLVVGENYRLLGVVNGEVTEDENFNLKLTNTLKGTAKANSGISTIVPADEIRTLLDDPRLQKLRDDTVNAPVAH